MFSILVVNVFIALSVAVLWLRQLRPAKEDPRLSKGLQLLQSKISVLEDLSDRTERQVKQLTQILDERAKALQTKMLSAEETIRKIEHSMQRSLNVAEIFQDKIPHQEIIERNQQAKYVLAAKLANEGYSAEEISAQVDIPKNEIEFITKVNREELSYDPELLPEWAKTQLSKQQEIEQKIVENVFQTQQQDFSSLKRIETEFKQTVRDAELTEQREIERMRALEEKAEALKQTASVLTQNLMSSANSMLKTTGEVLAKGSADFTKSAGQAITKSAGEVLKSTTDVVKQTAAQAQPVIRKVQFPRIHVDRKHLPQTIED